MDGEAEGSFSLVTMEVWSSSASEEEEEERSTSSLVDEVVEEEKICLNSNNNNNNNNNSDRLCREVTEGEISVCDEVKDKKRKVACTREGSVFRRESKKMCGVK